MHVLWGSAGQRLRLQLVEKPQVPGLESLSPLGLSRERNKISFQEGTGLPWNLAQGVQGTRNSSSGLAENCAMTELGDILEGISSTPPVTEWDTEDQHRTLTCLGSCCLAEAGLEF